MNNTLSFFPPATEDACTEIDKMRPACLEMINPQIELLSSIDHSQAAHDADKTASTEEIKSTGCIRRFLLPHCAGKTGAGERRLRQRRAGFSLVIWVT